MWIVCHCFYHASVFRATPLQDGASSKMRATFYSADGPQSCRTTAMWRRSGALEVCSFNECTNTDLDLPSCREVSKGGRSRSRSHSRSRSRSKSRGRELRSLSTSSLLAVETPQLPATHAAKDDLCAWLERRKDGKLFSKKKQSFYYIFRTSLDALYEYENETSLMPRKVYQVGLKEGKSEVKERLCFGLCGRCHRSKSTHSL